MKLRLRGSLGFDGEKRDRSILAYGTALSDVAVDFKSSP